MKKQELVAQLEAAKALTSVVSIDQVIALIQQLEEKVLLNNESFDKIMDVVDKAIGNLYSSDIVDFDNAEFDLYHNTIVLASVPINTNRIVAAIRETMENIFEESDDMMYGLRNQACI
jgi:hypothetical protein